MEYDSIYINARSLGESKQAELTLKNNGFPKHAMVLRLISRLLLNNNITLIDMVSNIDHAISCLSKCREKLTAKAINNLRIERERIENERKTSKNKNINQ